MSDDAKLLGLLILVALLFALGHCRCDGPAMMPPCRRGAPTLEARP